MTVTVDRSATHTHEKEASCTVYVYVAKKGRSEVKVVCLFAVLPKQVVCLCACRALSVVTQAKVGGRIPPSIHKVQGTLRYIMIMGERREISNCGRIFERNEESQKDIEREGKTIRVGPTKEAAENSTNRNSHRTE